MQIPGYRIIRRINQGGMSTVYLAIQQSVGRQVALKVMSPVLSADPLFSERFQREANIVGQLSHASIVSVYDIGRYRNLNYIAMDYLPGGSIHDRATHGFSAIEAVRVLSDVALALDHAHEKGYVHRDIKPENILFREDGTAVLTDFGVARSLSNASRITNSGNVVGTPHYMSPEQARGHAVDGRADLYSLGIVFYEMLTGCVPYQAEEAVAIAIKHLTAPLPKLPPQYSRYQKVLNRLLAKDPDDRYQRGRECVEALAELDGITLINRNVLLTTDSHTAVHAFALFKALVKTLTLASATRLAQGFSVLSRLRYSRQQGWHSLPDAINRSAIEGNDEGLKATVISPYAAIDDTDHFERLKSSRYRLAIISCCLLAAVATLLLSVYPLSSQPDTSPISHTGQDAATDEPLLPEDLPAANDMSTTTVAVAPDNGTEASQPSDQVADQPPPPPRYPLNVRLEPAGARIRVLNIVPKYYPGIPLPPGSYHIEVSAKGFDTERQWIELTQAAKPVTVSLRKTPVAGALFRNTLQSGGQGPEMVIIPSGNFTLGSQSHSDTTPQRKITIDQPFAVSRYEITFADWADYASATRTPLPDDHRWGKGSRPVINISWQQAEDYVQWLSRETGKRYRLLSEAEWEYAARAGGSDDYPWGQDATNRANCRRGCGSKFISLFSQKSAPVGTYKANAFGLYDMNGNVAEWVQDCYQPHYLDHNGRGSAVSIDACPQRVTRGGSMQSSLEAISNSVREALPPATTRSDTGLRIAVELY